MPNPYVILAVLLTWVGSLVGVGYWQRHDGEISERVTWQAKLQDQTQQANAALQAAQSAARKEEQDHAQQLSDISANYQKELQDASKQHAADVAAIRAGTLRLRDPGARPHACAGGVSQASTAAGRRDDQAGSGLPGPADGVLSDTAVEFLVSEADRADRLAKQLSACQAVINADRAPAQ